LTETTCSKRKRKNYRDYLYPTNLGLQKKKNYACGTLEPCSNYRYISQLQKIQSISYPLNAVTLATHPFTSNNS
jgi:hypothetical protein